MGRDHGAGPGGPRRIREVVRGGCGRERGGPEERVGPSGWQSGSRKARFSRHMASSQLTDSLDSLALHSLHEGSVNLMNIKHEEEVPHSIFIRFTEPSCREWSAKLSKNL
jgi:hypothetical protein